MLPSFPENLTHVRPPHVCLTYALRTCQALARVAEAKEASINQNQSDPTADTVEGAMEGANGAGDISTAIVPNGGGLDTGDLAVSMSFASMSEGRRDVVRAMFDVAWWPMLGAFSQVIFIVVITVERLAMMVLLSAGLVYGYALHYISRVYSTATDDGT